MIIPTVSPLMNVSESERVGLLLFISALVTAVRAACAGRVGCRAAIAAALSRSACCFCLSRAFLLV